MKRLVFTAVFNDYDRIYPPVHIEPDVDYVVVTDDADLSVTPWRTLYVDPSRFPTPKAANLYHRALIHRVLPGYDASLYVDGNIRLLGPAQPLFDVLPSTRADLAMFGHPLRDTLSEELEAIIEACKVESPNAAREEVDTYFSDGFKDSSGLFETTIMLKNHNSPRLHNAMALWWELFERHLGRDQLSFPYVVWKTGLRVHRLPGTFRERNPYFALYPHKRARNVNPLYAHVSARSHDNIGYRALLAAWHAQWTLQRKLRGN